MAKEDGGIERGQSTLDDLAEKRQKRKEQRPNGDFKDPPWIEDDGTSGTNGGNGQTKPAGQAKQRQPQQPKIPETRTACWLDKQQFPEVQWIMQNILPEGIAVCAGAPKIGKSWFWMDVSVGITAGGTVLREGLEIKRGEALYLALEDNDRRLQKRLRILLRGRTAPESLHYQTTWRSADKGGIQDLDAWLNMHPECRLIVIDTLAKFRARRNSRGANAYEEDYAVGGGLARLCIQHQVAIVLIHHVRKAESDDPLHMVSGTLGLTGGVDTILVMERSRGQETAKMSVIGRDIEDEGPYALEWNKAFCQWHIVGSGPKVMLGVTEGDILKMLEMSPEGASATMITRAKYPDKYGNGEPIDKESAERRTVYRALKILEKQGFIKKQGGYFLCIR